MSMQPAAQRAKPSQLDAAGTPAEIRAARRFVRTGQHLPPGLLATDTRDWADHTATDARSAWRTFFDRNRTDPADRGEWGNLAAASGATARAATAAVGHRAVLATVGRGSYQLDRAKAGLTRARSAAGNALDDMRTRPVRTALAAGGITLAAATVGAPVVAGATGLVLGRRALHAHAQYRATKDTRERARAATELELHRRHLGRAAPVAASEATESGTQAPE